jgi:hypothetical protein
VTLYRDSVDTREATFDELTVKTTEGLRIAMRNNGGFVVRFSE